MPAVRGAGPGVAREKFFILGVRQCGAVVGIETHGEHGKLVADIEGKRTQRAHQAIQEQGAKIAAFVIDEVDNDRLATEVIAKPYLVAAFIAKTQIERHLLGQFLIEGDLAQRRRPGVVMRARQMGKR